jgi:hypothetical protein
VLIDDSASIFCARVMRGTNSMTNVVTPFAASRSISSGLRPGFRNETSTTPERSRSASWPAGIAMGSRTFAITSARA